MVRSRVELWNNSDVGQAKPSIADDQSRYGIVHREALKSIVEERLHLELGVSREGVR